MNWRIADNRSSEMPLHENRVIHPGPCSTRIFCSPFEETFYSLSDDRPISSPSYAINHSYIRVYTVLTTSIYKDPVFLLFLGGGKPQRTNTIPGKHPAIPY